MRKILKNTTIPVALLIFALLIVGPVNAYAQGISGDDCYAHVVYLPKDIGCRVTGSPSNEIAGDYILQKFTEYGLDVKTQDFELNSHFSDECEEN